MSATLGSLLDSYVRDNDRDRYGYELRADYKQPAVYKAAKKQSIYDVSSQTTSPREAQEDRALEEEIEASRFILEIKEDLDPGETVSYSSQTLDCVASFLRRMMLHAHESRCFGLCIPRIAPASEGSIDVFWETNDRTLLMNFSGRKQLASFFGSKEGNKIAGEFDPGLARPDLTLWLLT